ncbi:pentatricopeptide repeat-containing protein At1g09190 [Vigna radiata var. radiata]|uniref:Pentatricopeptide repeat-containing protein At1g09190 n=1 Tax=Vigna radiata var. radiata TaxID=3916 RepID=A0A1S3V2P2_VIGRR|nr:pentatricopeptide repeat-containing protein At1g09190 [Vigna radiata var. radiata]
MSRSREIERKILRLLHGAKNPTQLTQIHAHFLRHGLHQSNQILAHFVTLCGAPYATRIFAHTPNPNILLFNAIIKAHSLQPPFHPSFSFFSLMKLRAISPDHHTFAPLIKSASNLRHYALGQSLHAHILRLGFTHHASVCVATVDLYTTCGRMDDASKVFDEMRDPDVVVWNLMIRGFCKTGDLETGLKLFTQMKERTVVSWNLMMSCLAQGNKDREVLELFNWMLDQGFEPDDASLVTVLPVCARLGDVDVGEWIHSYANSKGFLRDAVNVGNSLVDFYCKCGNLQASWGIFNEMANKNVVSWNAMISGLAYNGEGEVGVGLFEEMVRGGVEPNDSTFVGVLTCCAHAGLVDRGREIFASMSVNFGVPPKLEHYGCVVDLLGRCGHVREALDLITSMPLKPTAALWGALLSACRTHGDREIAEIAAKELVGLEPWNSGNYVLLSNVYAEEGRWDEVEKVRLLMRGGGVNKVPGQSATG